MHQQGSEVDVILIRYVFMGTIFIASRDNNSLVFYWFYLLSNIYRELWESDNPVFVGR